MNLTKDDSLLGREKYLRKIADFADKFDQRLAQFYRMTVKDLKSTEPDVDKTDAEKELTICVYCSSPLRFGQYSIRLKPRLQFTPRISRLLQKYSQNPRSLGFYQQKLVRDYKYSRNKVEVTCFLCKKKWKIKGQSCTKRLQQKQKFAKEQQLKGEVQKNALGKKKKKKKRKRAENEEDQYAGLNIDVIKKLRKIEDTSQSKQSANDMSLPQTDVRHTKTEKVDTTFVKTDIPDAVLSKTEKTVIDAKLQLLEKIEDGGPKKNVVPQSIRDKKRNKQRFVSKLSKILKREKEKEKGKEPEKEKGMLQAFLSSL